IRFAHALLDKYAPQASAENVRLRELLVRCQAWMLSSEHDRPNMLIALIQDALQSQPQADKDGCTCPSGDGSLRHPCPMHPGVDKDGGQQLGWRVTDDMRYAVRFAPSSAHWSERLKEFFGPDAREGIDALEKQLREARAMLDRQPKLRADASAVRRALIAASNYIDTLGGDSKSYRAALSGPQAEQGGAKP
ncbi:hypothetical protein, partial [Achromobacter xylosoxidans]|uniref:hypothetical protein n=1 Tax=Alcaligenes xylosoxydans xylosoxydans TaxID=85698 RepID=UPI001EEE6CF3